MRIHTHECGEVEEILKKLGLKYKKMDKKVRDQSEYRWYGLPGFINDPTLLETGYYDIDNKLLGGEMRVKLFKAFGQKVSRNQYIHYKKRDSPYKDYEYEITREINPHYPIYVISKGRWETKYTIDALEEMNCPYHVVIEPQEVDKYVGVGVSRDKILILPDKYLNKNQGGIPARNFCWEDSVKKGWKKHWVLDDNLRGFYRWNYNTIKKIKSGVVFRVAEDYCARFDNVGLAALNYSMDIRAIHIEKSMIQYNTKCYSCILINNRLMDKYGIGRWEGKYNEDVDLVIRTLKAGYTTISFNNLLANKQSTGMKGGNNTIYKGCSHEGFQNKFDELKNKHPEYVKLIVKHKDKRPHHRVDYHKITDKLPEMKPEFEYMIPSVNEYNMIFKSRGN